jgi:DNA-binding Lrp family transcriptional regulator
MPTIIRVARPKTKEILMEFDPIDRKILNLLGENARMTNSELAAACNIAASTCLTRVKNLVQAGVITGFTAKLNRKLIGLENQVLISVTLRAGARSHLAEFMESMSKHPDVIQVFFLGGQEDFLVHLGAKSSDQVRDFVLENLSNNPTVASTRTNMVFEHFSKAPTL